MRRLFSLGIALAAVVALAGCTDDMHAGSSPGGGDPLITAQTAANLVETTRLVAVLCPNQQAPYLQARERDLHQLLVQDVQAMRSDPNATVQTGQSLRMTTIHGELKNQILPRLRKCGLSSDAALVQHAVQATHT